MMGDGDVTKTSDSNTPPEQKKDYSALIVDDIGREECGEYKEAALPEYRQQSYRMEQEDCSERRSIAVVTQHTGRGVYSSK